MKFNTRNKDLSDYSYDDFIEDNYDELFDAFKNGFYNPETGEKSEEAFGEWFEQNNHIRITESFGITLPNPIDDERRIRYIETRTYPIWVTYPDGHHELHNFKHLLERDVKTSEYQYAINSFAWDHFTRRFPEQYEDETESEKIALGIVKDIQKIIKSFGELKFCIKGDYYGKIVAYYEPKKPVDMVAFIKQNRKFVKKYSTTIYLQEI